MRVFESLKVFPRGDVERGATVVEYLLLLGLVALGCRASFQFFSLSVESKAMRAACQIEFAGGGTSGTIGGDERGGGENGASNFTPGSTPDPRSEAARVSACITKHLETMGRVTRGAE